jgi:AcrR family transcriptional regulator
MTNETETSRRERILEAAEKVFGEHGFTGASLRRIVVEAKVNLATVYYYFGSKNGLMEAVLKRRFGPLRAEQLEILGQKQAAVNGGPLEVEQILEAMLAPPLRLAVQSSSSFAKGTEDKKSKVQSSKAGQKQCRDREGAPPVANGEGSIVTRLIGRIVTEPDEQTQAILRSQREDVRAAFFKAFQASFPDVAPAELYWRLEFVWGALAFILCNPRRLEVETGGMCDPADTGKVLSEMIAFFSAGFAALKGQGSQEVK